MTTVSIFLPPPQWAPVNKEILDLIYSKFQRILGPERKTVKNYEKIYF